MHYVYTYFRVDSKSAHFERTDLPSSFVYFSKFVNLKLGIARQLMLTNWSEQHTWREILQREAQKYVEIGEKMIREYPKLQSCYGYSCVSIRRNEIKVSLLWAFPFSFVNRNGYIS